MRKATGYWFGVFAGSVLLINSTMPAAITITDVGRFEFTDSDASEISGITYAGGGPSSATFYAVGDGSSRLHSMSLNIHSATGAITSASISSASLQLRNADGSAIPAGPDREGVAYDASTNSVYISNEGPNAVPNASIRRHRLSDGNTTLELTPSSHAQLNVYNNIRDNRGWESFTRQSNGASSWTANEDTLNGDGSLSGGGFNAPGGIHRLQRFDSNLVPNGQWRYQSDGAEDDFFLNFMERTGVSDLLVLPDGQLIVMERAVGTRTLSDSLFRFRIRLYLVSLDPAAQVDGGALAGSTAVGKSLLWEKTFDNNIDNFEGIALGPSLPDAAAGTYSLILAADNGSGATHSLYALTLNGVPEPSGMILTGAAMFWLGSRRRRHR